MIDITPYVPLLVSAAKYLASSAAQWMSKRTPDERDQSKKRLRQFIDDPEMIRKYANARRAEASAHTLEQLLIQISTHQKALADLTTQKAELDIHTPPHVNRSIERNQAEIEEKTERVKLLFEEIFDSKL